MRRHVNPHPQVAGGSRNGRQGYKYVSSQWKKPCCRVFICSIRPSSSNPLQSALVYASSIFFFLFNYLPDALGLHQLSHQETTPPHTHTHTGGSVRKESACNAGDPGSTPGLGEDPLGKGIATHSSILAWRIPWTEECVWAYSPWRLTEESHDLATKPPPAARGI